jgi:hypothetical protein
VSILRPSDPTLPPDPLGSRADIHLTGATSAVTLFILILLNATVFRGGTMSADIAWAVAPVASYIVSTATGRLARRRLLKAAHAAAQTPPGSETPPAP